MKILITNDDGLGATQLPALIAWCQKLGDVTVIVPKNEQSGKSHGIELHRAIEAKQVPLVEGVPVWAIDSTPADCIRFGVLGLKLSFDLVISGINRGLNVGVDIMYSGTCAAAFEAVNLGIPALAISVPPEGYDNATAHLDRVYTYLQEHRLFTYNPIYNINIPPAAGPIRITRQGGPYFSDDYRPDGNDLYTPVGVCVYQDSQDDSLDIDAVMHGYISITPLTINRVDMAVYHRLTEELNL